MSGLDPDIIDAKDVVAALAAAVDAPIIAYAALAAELAEAGALDMKRLAQRIAERAADTGLSERTRVVLRRYGERR